MSVRFQGLLAGLLLWLCVLAPLTNALAQTTQTPPPPPQKSQDEVIRVYTELVQTDVMVMDKQGQFIDGLKKEDFELRIDGKPRPIEAFEKITAGSNEEAQLAAARGATTINLKRPVPLDRGRIVFFYIDDFHMDQPGVVAVRKVISTLIDKHMGQNDQVALASASGQIGFLQQLTGDRKVLRLALDRVTSRRYVTTDHDRPPMREYEAMLIDRNDRQVLDYFTGETMRQNPGLTRSVAEQIVRNRAQSTMTQASHANINMLSGLESLVRSARNLPGRKVLFFLSGGFLLENYRGSTTSKLRDIINYAAKGGVVIYSMDTRGLVASLRDASTEAPFDPGGQLQMSTGGELGASQDGMNALAVDTGGKALFNANDLSKGLAPAIKETATYYLLAWKPDPATQKQGRFRQLEVKLVNRPDLTVRVRKGFFDTDPPGATANAKKPEQSPSTKTPTVKLREAIATAYPLRALPILMSVDYYDIADKGPMLSTAVQLPGEFLSFGEQPDGKIQAIVDVSGVFYDDKGTPKTSFIERIVSTAPSLEAARTNQADITFTYPAQLPPGLYQVRVAARDDKSGNVGSAHSWIEIPDLTKKQLMMSSLLLGDRPQAKMGKNASDTESASPVALSASHRFHRESMMRFLFFAYNTKPSPADNKPDVAVQVQVIRDDQPVITTALRKITTDGVADLARLPYAAEIPMNELLPGRYLLRVSLIDRVSKQSTSRETHFDVY
ncbi:MAG TPA: VWA domain-containing protein [Pyrinomonadaceae bacterium]|nr:VWA domain-containing protein [Pyrinomonadaceae bacterium]